MKENKNISKKISWDEKINFRLKEFFESTGLSQEDFANKIDVLQPNFSSMLSNKRSVGKKIIDRAANAFPELNKIWLSDNIGTMLKAEALKNSVSERLEKFLLEETSFTVKKFEKEVGWNIDDLKEYDESKIEDLKKIFKDLDIDWLLTGKKNYQNGQKNKSLNEPETNYNRMPAIITIPEEDKEKENIEVVPVKLAAGYVGGGYADPSFVKTLPKFRLPFLNNGTFRCFGVDGHSLERGIHDKDFFIGQFVDNLANFGEGKIHAVIAPKITDDEPDSLLIKRVFRHPIKNNYLILRSDNNDRVNHYPDIHINIRRIKEMWSYCSLISFKEPEYDMEKFRDILGLNLDNVILD